MTRYPLAVWSKDTWTDSAGGVWCYEPEGSAAYPWRLVQPSAEALVDPRPRAADGGVL